MSELGSFGMRIKKAELPRIRRLELPEVSILPSGRSMTGGCQSKVAKAAFDGRLQITLSTAQVWTFAQSLSASNEKIEKLHAEDERMASFIHSVAKPGVRPVSGWRWKRVWYSL